MNVSILKNIGFDQCQSLYMHKLKDKTNLPQHKEFVELTANESTRSLIVNGQFYSLEELRNKIIKHSRDCTNYFYLAVNKFNIYSTVDVDAQSDQQHWDQLLVDYCYSAIKDQFDMISWVVRPDDVGQLGNFIHPVTTMIFKRHG